MTLSLFHFQINVLPPSGSCRTFLTSPSIQTMLSSRQFQTSAAIAGSTPDQPQPAKPAEKSSPIKEAVKLYGKIVVVIYVVGGLVNLSLCYLAVAK